MGEGKHGNQNNALIFIRGKTCQTIDTNQDNYMNKRLQRADLENYDQVVKVFSSKSSFSSYKEKSKSLYFYYNILLSILFYNIYVKSKNIIED